MKNSNQSQFPTQSVVNDLFDPPQQILDDNQQLNPLTSRSTENNSICQKIKSYFPILLCIVLTVCVFVLLSILSKMSNYLAQTILIQQQQNEAIQNLIASQQAQNLIFTKWAKKYYESQYIEDDIIDLFNGTNEEQKYAVYKAFNALEKDKTTGIAIRDWNKLYGALQDKKADDQWKLACDTITQYAQKNKY